VKNGARAGVEVKNKDLRRVRGKNSNDESNQKFKIRMTKPGCGGGRRREGQAGVGACWACQGGCLVVCCMGGHLIWEAGGQMARAGGGDGMLDV